MRFHIRKDGFQWVTFCDFLIDLGMPLRDARSLKGMARGLRSTAAKFQRDAFYTNENAKPGEVGDVSNQACGEDLAIWSTAILVPMSRRR